jgi:hypothetical protein
MSIVGDEADIPESIRLVISIIGTLSNQMALIEHSTSIAKMLEYLKKPFMPSLNTENNKIVRSVLNAFGSRR